MVTERLAMAYGGRALRRYPSEFKPGRPHGPTLLPVSGSVAWLDGADLSKLTLAADGISAWADKSGAGADATAGVAAARPTPMIHPTLFNGRCVIRFDGNDDRLAQGGLDASDRTQTMFLAGNVQSLAGYSTILGANASGGRQIRVDQTTGKITCNKQGTSGIFTTTTLAVTAGTPFVLAVKLDTTSWECRLTGGTTETGSESTAFTAARTTSIGENTQTLSERYLGHMAELVVFPTALSSGDMDLMVQYLRTKWGI